MQGQQRYYWQRQIDERAKDVTYGFVLLVLLCMFFVAGMLYVIAVNIEDTAELEWIEYTVQPGDTLWGIAATNVHSQAIDKTVWQIRERNGIDPVIRPGQVLEIPVSRGVDEVVGCNVD